MTSRHLLRGATKRGVFLGGDKNESDRASDQMLTFLSPRPIENHDPCSKLRRKTTTKTKKSRDTIVVAFVFLLTYYLSFSWTTTSGGRVHNTSVSSERALELRAKYAKLAKAEKERALKLYGYHGGGHLLGGNHIGHHRRALAIVKRTIRPRILQKYAYYRCVKAPIRVIVLLRIIR